ncbi:hypothetical protein CesoFtcFv8_021668 [Champsocephalus esox]|uniref:Uncharacterized protein n=1 Tax=Champsocephalus esox TaxID=159716 RepID=A0AAN8B9V1_9TELE|nr:hypothetical protein CesoFtcFv8_021668 [Champsocephalus esox]
MRLKKKHEANIQRSLRDARFFERHLAASLDNEEGELGPSGGRFKSEADFFSSKDKERGRRGGGGGGGGGRGSGTGFVATSCRKS